MNRLTTAPPPPAGLDPAAAETWRELAAGYVQTGTLTASDLPLLRLAAEALADERAARRVIEAEGLTIATAAGGRKSHPALKVRQAARATAMRLLLALGSETANRPELWDDREPFG